jgi:hypothetical protein
MIINYGDEDQHSLMLWKITQWANQYFQGVLPPSIRDLMIASRIVFIPKSDGSSRPLGIGEAWLRLFGRILSKKFAARLAIQLSPIQLCVGISGGCEIAARLSDIYMSRSDYLGCPGFLKVDASNAFNEIRRGIIYDNLRELCPELCAVFRMLYGQPSYLLSSDGKIVGCSSTGCRQGDPLSMTFFAVGFQKVLQNIRTAIYNLETNTLAQNRYNPGFICAYADDVGIAADVNILTELYPMLHQLYAEVGLRISSKSTLVNPFDLPIQAVDNLSLCADGTTFLGVPIGTSGFKSQQFSDTIKRMLPPMKVLQRLPSQFSFQLLTRCIISRPNYICSICEVDDFWNILHDFDTSVDDSIAEIARIQPLNLTQMQIRSLPDRFGGMNVFRYVGPFGARLRLLSRSRVIAFGPSVAELSDVITRLSFPNGVWKDTNLWSVSRIFHNECNFTELAANVDERDASYPSALKKIEKFYYSKIQSSLLDSMYLRNDTRSLQEAAWLRSNSFHGSFRWSNSSLASGFAGSRWNTSTFQAALQLRLFSDVNNLNVRQVCQFCQPRHAATVIESSLHALSCGLTAGLRNIRHTAVSHELQVLLKRIYPNVLIENEPTVFENTNRVIRSDIRYHVDGNPIIIDVGIACPTSHISGANDLNSAYHECGAADAMEQRKRQNVERFIGRGFIPFVVESTGRLGRAASLFLHRLCVDRTELKTSFLYNLSTHIAQESGRMLQFLRAKYSAF